jgi:hypothetical protein
MSLPFKLSAQTKGAQKAYQNFINRYGVVEGQRIFLARAEEHGSGSTIRQKVNSVYKKGGQFHDGE